MALPALRAATVHDLRRHGLGRDRVAASTVRLIDLGLFRIGGERYAELDHHYGATTLEKRHVSLTRDGARFDYIATHADGHFTAKEFRTWNATVLMALALANAGPSPAGRRRSVIAAAVREVAAWLGDTPAVTKASYIDPSLITRYTTSGELPLIPPLPLALPAEPEAELAIAEFLGASM